jgi:hypothetical protein
LCLGEDCNSDSTVFNEKGSAARMRSGSSSVVYTDGPGAERASPNLLTAKVLTEQPENAQAAAMAMAATRNRTCRWGEGVNVLSG